MPRVSFEFDPEFDDNIKKASNKSNSSLRPLFDQVRDVTDNIYFAARDRIQGEANRAESDAQAARARRFSNTGGPVYQHAKAKAFALKSAANSTKPTMEYDGDEIFGRVAIYRKGSGSVEFGGLDPVAEIGKGTGEYVSHPPYAFLRRAMDGA